MHAIVDTKSIQPLSVPTKKLWKKEEFDEYVPDCGFISDFVLATRGIETPAIFTTWTALFMISSVLKRDVWIEHYPGNLFGNLYVVFVTPPGMSYSITALEQFGIPILQSFPSLISDDNWWPKKKVDLITGHLTTDRFANSINPRGIEYPFGKNWVEALKKSDEEMISQGVFVLDDLPTNQDIIDTLNFLHDSPEYNETFFRHRTGLRRVENVYISLLASTTKENLLLPADLLSKTIVVLQNSSTRSVPIPREVVPNAHRELAMRLAWIADHARGEYRLSPDAHQRYDELVVECQKKVNEELATEGNQVQPDFGIHLLKIALLNRVSRYEDGIDIALSDVEDADSILKATYTSSEETRPTEFTKWVKRIRNRIQNRPGCTRRSILKSWGGVGLTTNILSDVLTHLNEEGVLLIKLDGETRKAPSTRSNERYWLR